MDRQQCHDLVTEEFRRFKVGDSSPESRIALAYKLTDQYLDEHDSFPHLSVIRRLTTLLLVGELADRNPHKAKHTEYPFFSRAQMESRHKREVITEDVIYGDRRFMGRKRSYFTDDNGAPRSAGSKLIG